jgi:hypothetical protein
MQKSRAEKGTCAHEAAWGNEQDRNTQQEILSLLLLNKCISFL